MAQSTFKYIIIDTRDRIKGNTNEFTVNLNPAFYGVKKVELLSLSLPQTMYNITTANNIIYFSEGGGPLIASLSPGNYNASSLANAISILLSTISPNAFIYNVSVSNITYKMTISASGNFSLLFGSNSTQSIGDFIGYTIDTIPALTHTGDSIIQLYQSVYYIIDIAELPVAVKSSNIKDYGTFVINTRTNGGDIEVFEIANRYHIIENYDNAQNIFNLNIKLKTYDNKLVDINNAEWFMMLKFIY